MGNTNCVATGGTPHRCDIVIANNTDFPLDLDLSQGCGGEECNHRGFQVNAGKIVHGFEPPSKIGAHSLGRFSVSGREGSAVAPNGKVYYRNDSLNLNVVISWANSGWTSTCLPAFGGNVSGKPDSQFSSDPKPWNDVIVCEGDWGTWIMAIKQIKKLGDDSDEANNNVNSVNSVNNVNNVCFNNYTSTTSKEHMHSIQ